MRKLACSRELGLERGGLVQGNTYTHVYYTIMQLCKITYCRAQNVF